MNLLTMAGLLNPDLGDLEEHDVRFGRWARGDLDDEHRKEILEWFDETQASDDAKWPKFLFEYQTNVRIGVAYVALPGWLVSVEWPELSDPEADKCFINLMELCDNESPEVSPLVSAYLPIYLAKFGIEMRTGLGRTWPWLHVIAGGQQGS